MRIFRYIATAAAAILLNTAMWAQDVRADFEREVVTNASVKKIDCKFTQTRSVAVLSGDVVRKGDFSLRQPGTIRLQFEDGDYILMGETEFEIKSEGRVNKMKVNANPMLKELKRVLSACMGGDVASIMAGFDSEVSATAKSYNVKLCPKGKKNGMMKSLELQFNRKDMSLDWMKMTERNGDYTLYTFTDKKIEK